MITWCGSLSTSSWSAPVSSTTSTRCTLPSSTTSASHSSTRWSWERPTATSGYVSHLARCIIIFVLMQFSGRCRIRRTPSDCPPFYSAAYVPRVIFQQAHVGRHGVLPDLLWPADRSRPLHHQSNTCLHTICITISFIMSMPPQSGCSQHIPNIASTPACKV